MSGVGQYLVYSVFALRRFYCLYIPIKLYITCGLLHQVLIQIARKIYDLGVKTSATIRSRIFKYVQKP